MNAVNLLGTLRLRLSGFSVSRQCEISLARPQPRHSLPALIPAISIGLWYPVASMGLLLVLVALPESIDCQDERCKGKLITRTRRDAYGMYLIARDCESSASGTTTVALWDTFEKEKQASYQSGNWKALTWPSDRSWSHHMVISFRWTCAPWL